MVFMNLIVDTDCDYSCGVVSHIKHWIYFIGEPLSFMHGTRRLSSRFKEKEREQSCKEIYGHAILSWSGRLDKFLVE